MNNSFDFENYLLQSQEPDTEVLLSCLLGKNVALPHEFGTVWQQLLPETRSGFHPEHLGIQRDKEQRSASTVNLSLSPKVARLGKIREGP